MAKKPEITITQKDMEAACPALIHPSPALYEKARPFFEEVWGGFNAYAVIDWDFRLGYDPVPSLKAYVVAEGLLRALPHMDLVAAPTGFGVVNTQNLAPASRERVEAVRRALEEASSDALDAADEIVGGRIYRRIFPTARLFAAYGHTAPDGAGGSRRPLRADLRAADQAVAAAGEALARLVGRRQAELFIREYYASYDKWRGKYLGFSEEDGKVASAAGLDLARQFASAHMRGDRAAAARLGDRLRDLMETARSRDERAGMKSERVPFIFWYTSRERAAWLAPRYQNRRGDPTFFFG